MSSKQNLDEISGKTFQRRVALRLLPYLYPQRGKISILMSLVFVSAGFSLYTPKLLGQIVDKALVPKNFSLLYYFVALYAGLEFLRIISIYLQSYGLQKVGQSVMQNIRSDLFGRLLRMPISFFDKNPTGRLVTRVTNDTMNLSELFSSGFVMLLSDIVLIVGVICAMLFLHWKLGLLVISVFPIMIGIMVLFSGKLRMAFRHSREVLARLNGFFAERMAGMPIVQLMEKESFEKESFKTLSEEYREKQTKTVYLYSLFHPSITILGGASVAIAIWFGPQFISSQEIALGTFVSFLAYAQVLYQPVRNITDRYNVFLAAMSSAERIFSLLDLAEEEGLRGNLEHSEKKSKGQNESATGLSFENVTFRYPSLGETEGNTLSKLSFKVKTNETIAIVGHTGAGKTTLTSLLFRFYEPNEGAIFLDGTPLTEIPKTELRKRIGFVQQEVFLFSGTLRDNLTLGNRNLTDSEILEGCKKTGFLNVLERLPNGLDSELDERGSNLSMGERQILTFTRVFLQKPEVLVLDEATSSVDRNAEMLLQNATKELMKNRTCIVIAHRLETVKRSDKILVLHRGKVVEEGNHEELLKRNGTYAKFVGLQAQLH